MTDERRERYGRALAEDYGDYWDSLTDEERELWRRSGDAAKAVADEEQQELLHDRIRHIDTLEAEKARLRAELEQQLDSTLSKQYADLSRIDRERAKLPAEERQRLEVGDAPLLRIQLLHMLERARKAERAVNLLADAHRRAEQAEAAIERVESYAHELRYEDAMGLLAALDGPATDPAKHTYLSTGCLHGEHGYCQAHTGLSGAKTPAVCKWCKAPCQCPCHRSATAEEK